jgi:hypothetical protein
MVGQNKVDKASILNEEVYFFFSFTDGLYFWLYNKIYKIFKFKQRINKKLYNIKAIQIIIYNIYLHIALKTIVDIR